LPAEGDGGDLAQVETLDSRGYERKSLFLPMRLAPRHRRNASAGFSLAELAVVVAMLGCLLMAGVPRLNQLTEQAKVAEAFVFLSHVSKAQERYRARGGAYAQQLEDLDLSFRAPRWFVIGQAFSIDWETRWSQRLVRREPSSGYGSYAVVFTEEGFHRERSTIPDELVPATSVSR
jgi:Tfp pilus assembly protein PilE